MKWPLSEVMILMYVLLIYIWWSSKVYLCLTLIVLQLFRESCIHIHVKVLSTDGEDIIIQSHDHQGYGILQECMSVSVGVSVCVVRVWCFSESLRGWRSASPPVICLNSLLLIRWQSNWPWLPCICLNVWMAGEHISVHVLPFVHSIFIKKFLQCSQVYKIGSNMKSMTSYIHLLPPSMSPVCICVSNVS